MSVPATQATESEMAKARLPIEYRDVCSKMLISLNKCRGETFYLPWKCENERHEYEKCQYDDYKRRAAAMKAQKEEE
ncbi:B18 subunit of NADH:ubiquinone oxidoreductase [Chlamydoabsidia padenii]|nr:B18 subunit of NADH:ubiquinone oxidoreductase [Chlamydoabsidia padenii]